MLPALCLTSDAAPPVMALSASPAPGTTARARFPGETFALIAPRLHLAGVALLGGAIERRPAAA
jgi:hypothetical protein